MGDFSKGGAHKTDVFWNVFFFLLKIKRPGRLFRQIRYLLGGGWTLVAGDKEGQTQVDTPEMDDFTLWSHPIDLHYAAKGIQGMCRSFFIIFSEKFLC